MCEITCIFISWQTTLTQSQDKGLRRISEMKEVRFCSCIRKGYCVSNNYNWLYQLKSNYNWLHMFSCVVVWERFVITVSQTTRSHLSFNEQFKYVNRWRWNKNFSRPLIVLEILHPFLMRLSVDCSSLQTSAVNLWLNLVHRKPQHHSLAPSWQANLTF